MKTRYVRLTCALLAMGTAAAMLSCLNLRVSSIPSASKYLQMRVVPASKGSPHLLIYQPSFFLQQELEPRRLQCRMLALVWSLLEEAAQLFVFYVLCEVLYIPWVNSRTGRKKNTFVRVFFFIRSYFLTRSFVSPSDKATSSCSAFLALRSSSRFSASSEYIVTCACTDSRGLNVGINTYSTHLDSFPGPSFILKRGRAWMPGSLCACAIHYPIVYCCSLQNRRITCSTEQTKGQSWLIGRSVVLEKKGNLTAGMIL